MASQDNVFVKVNEIRVREVGDKVKCSITGLASLPNGTLCLCDYSNTVFKLYDNSFGFLNKWSFLKPPYDVATEGNSTVLVTVPSEKRLYFGCVSETGGLRFEKSIIINNSCWGVTVNQDAIYVTCGRKSSGEPRYVLVLTLDGTLQRTISISLFEGPNYIALSDLGHIYVTDYEAGTVICLDENEVVRYTVNDARLRCPLGLIAGGDETIYVCGGRSKTVCLIMADGKRLVDAINEQEHVDMPWSLYLRSKDGMIFLGMRDSDVLLVYRLNSHADDDTAFPDVSGDSDNSLVFVQELSLDDVSDQGIHHQLPTALQEKSDPTTPTKLPRPELPVDPDLGEEQWNCSTCTFLNHPEMINCELCEMPKMIANMKSPSYGNEDLKHEESAIAQSSPSQGARQDLSGADGEQWNCSYCTFLNRPDSYNCECCDSALLRLDRSIGSSLALHEGSTLTESRQEPLPRPKSVQEGEPRDPADRPPLTDSCSKLDQATGMTADSLTMDSASDMLMGPRQEKLPRTQSVEDLHNVEPAAHRPVAESPVLDKTNEITPEALATDNASDNPIADLSQEVTPTLKKTENIEVLSDLLVYKDKLIWDGRSSTVYEGRFESNIPVAIKKIYLAQSTITVDIGEQLKILREVENARKMPIHNHPNIVRFIKSQVESDFLYIAFELCQGTLQDYVNAEFNWTQVLPLKCVLRQMTCGLQFLHDTVKIAHRDLKPSNVLLVQSQTATKIVLADFGQAKSLENLQCSMSGQPGSLGWIAKEVDEYQQSGRHFHQNSDIFSLGCLFYYVATDGKHPFGSTPIQQQAGITNEKPNIDGLPPHLQCLKELISDMIVHRPEERPSTGMIMEHPALFDDVVIIKFLHKASNLINNYPQARQNILEDPSVIPGNNWVHLLPINTRTYLSNFTLPRHPQPMFQGKEASVRHLLRAIRNCSEHVKDLDATMRAEMGSSHTDHVQFWLTHFPWLLTHVYDRMKGDQELMDAVHE